MVARNLLRSLPNLITVVRLLLVPATVALLVNERWGPAFAAFLVAGVSDAVDGFLARRFDCRTELGAHLDPLADKALLVSIYVWLAIDGVMPATIAILVVSRDVMIVGAVVMSWVLNQPMKISPLWVSKANTAAQIAFAALALGERAIDVRFDMARETLLWCVAALTIASTAAYLQRWLRHMGAI
jgi:cardiolipin synthase (CMP-forming)